MTVYCRAVLEDDLMCPDVATEFLTIKDKLGTYDVPVCKKHKAERNNKAARFRVSKKS